MNESNSVHDITISQDTVAVIFTPHPCYQLFYTTIKNGHELKIKGLSQEFCLIWHRSLHWTPVDLAYFCLTSMREIFMLELCRFWSYHQAQWHPLLTYTQSTAVKPKNKRENKQTDHQSGIQCFSLDQYQDRSSLHLHHDSRLVVWGAKLAGGGIITSRFSTPSHEKWLTKNKQ